MQGIIEDVETVETLESEEVRGIIRLAPVIDPDIKGEGATAWAEDEADIYDAETLDMVIHFRGKAETIATEDRLGLWD